MEKSHTSTIQVPYSIPFIPTKTKIDLNQAFDDGAISGSGYFVSEIERRLSELLGVTKSISVSNGSAAIRLAFQIANLKPGMKVILPGWGFHVAANVAYSMGADIEFRDVSMDSWCLELDENLDLLSQESKAILVLIQTLGNFGKMKTEDDFRKNDNLFIIEDAAEALFSKKNGKSLGTLFDLGTYSFHAAKTITTGEGGLVVTSDEIKDSRGRLIRNQGMRPERPYYHEVAGDNYRLSNLLASLLVQQLNEIEVIIEKRKHVYQTYIENLYELPESSFIRQTDPVGFFPWGFGFRIPLDSKCTQNQLRSALRNRGVDTRPGFTSASELPYFKELRNSSASNLLNSDLLSSSVVLLPHYPNLSDESIHLITQTILSEL